MPDVSEKEIITIVVVGSFVSLLLVAFLVSFVYFYQRRHFAFLQEKESIRFQYQEELLKTQLEIQEATFKSISEEIHDNIGQTLSFVKLNLNTMNPILIEPQERKWEESKELLTKVIQDLRGLSRSLNTDFIKEIGVAGAIRQQLDLLERTGLYTIFFDVQGEKRRLDAGQELVLYRVMQELLNNIVRHADAQRIGLTMSYEATRLRIILEDDGSGFDMEQIRLREDGGIGLQNIKNRIAMITGTLTIDSSPGAGTRIHISLPQTD